MGAEPWLQKRNEALPDSVTLGKKKAWRIKDGIRIYVHRSVAPAQPCWQTKAVRVRWNNTGLESDDEALWITVTIPASVLMALVVCGVSGPIFSKAFPW